MIERDGHLVELVLSSGKAPEWVLVSPFGEVKTTKGSFFMDRATAERVIAAHVALRRDRVVDYEHQTLGGEYARPDGQAPAAAWVDRLELRADGLWAHVAWTEKARAAVEAKEYRYLSPVFPLDKQRRPLELHSLALTNDPAIVGQAPLVNKGQPGGAPDQEVTMTWLLTLLGLAAGTDEMALKGAVEGLVALKNRAEDLGKKLGVKNLDEVEGLFGELTTLRAYKAETLEALGLGSTAGTSEAKGTLLALKNAGGTHADLAQELAVLKAQLAERSANEAVDAALAEGKLTPAQRPWAIELAKKDPAAFTAYRAAAPVVVAGGRTVSATSTATGEQGLTVDELAVCKQLGLSAEAFKKHNPATEG